MIAHDTEKTTKASQRNARFGFRTTPDVKQIIERAAALSGQDSSSFALAAAYERALSTIQAHEVTRLTPEDHRAFFVALENPPAPTEKLSSALARHDEKVVER
jgi:uncharacterized protein (DUF1778 family)